MSTNSPPHPGHLISKECLEPNGLSVAEGARILRVSRTTLSKLVNGRSAISAEMAIRLDKAFGGKAETWYLRQTSYDFAMAQKNADAIDVKRYRPG